MLLFLNEIGEDYIKTNFDANDENVKSHNIIKTLIIKQMYFKTEKNKLFDLFEANRNNSSEYTFIDIIVPKSKVINLFSITKLFTDKENDHYAAHEIYNLIKAANISKKITSNYKIGELVQLICALRMWRQVTLLHMCPRLLTPLV